MSTAAFLGRGWGFPIRPNPRTGALDVVDGVEKVAQSIWLILSTSPGERVMRPAFGCGLDRYLMMPNATATRALIQREVQLAINTWEPRVSLTAVRVEEGNDPSLVLIEVEYVHVRDGRPGNLVFPFYLNP